MKALIKARAVVVCEPGSVVEVTMDQLTALGGRAEPIKGEDEAAAGTQKKKAKIKE